MAQEPMARKGKQLTLKVFGKRKASGEKLVVVTAYDLTSALIGAAGGADALLVGDSLGMVVLGHDTTLPVTMADMLHHCRAVARANPKVPIIVDMPYGSFHISVEETVANALRLVKEGGAHAVKIEGGRVREDVIKGLIAAEIPVMGHLGLTPQSVNRFGGYQVQGRAQGAADELAAEAELLADWGCFAIVLECIPAPLAASITSGLAIPTVGIGAGADCDGQVLVFHDLLGLFTGMKPKFVKRYAELGELARDAIARFASEVRSGDFPGDEHTYETEAHAPSGGTAAEPGAQAGYLDGVDEESR